MSTTKNSQILQYCQFHKIIKVPGTSLQSPALSKKHVRNVLNTAQWYMTKFYLDSIKDSKETSISVTYIM